MIDEFSLPSFEWRNWLNLEKKEDEPTKNEETKNEETQKLRTEKNPNLTLGDFIEEGENPKGKISDMHNEENLIYTGRTEEDAVKDGAPLRGLADDIFGVPEDMSMNVHDQQVYIFNASFDNDYLAD